MYLLCICKLFPPSFLLPSISYKSNVALQQRHLWSTKRVYPNDEMNIVGKFFFVSFERPPQQKKNYFVNFPAWEKCHTLLENSRNARKNFCGLSKQTTDFLIFFRKVCVFLKNLKKYKKSEKIKWHKKLAVHQIFF